MMHSSLAAGPGPDQDPPCSPLPQLEGSPRELQTDCWQVALRKLKGRFWWESGNHSPTPFLAWGDPVTPQGSALPP